MFWDRDRKTIIHFIGIGGSGMSGIAEVLLTNGFVVSGSDVKEGPVLDLLRSKGAQVYVGHHAKNLGDVRCVVVSTAVQSTNVEWQEAQRRNIPVIRRAEMLAELMRLKKGVAVAGSHGKTTSTSFLGQLLKPLQPTVVVGGLVQSWGSSTLVGKGATFVVEADESDRSFLHYSPVYSLVTNIDLEHLDTYADLQDIQETFLDFLNRTAFFGENWISAECPNLNQIRSRIAKPTRSFGFSETADLRATQLKLGRTGSEFLVSLEGKDLGEFFIPVPGEHNVMNFLGAMGVASSLGVSSRSIKSSAKNLFLSDRRLQTHFSNQDSVVIEDYAHHPSEIEATLKTIRIMYPDSYLRVIFQPHRYSRTRLLLKEFADCFNQYGDELTLLPIYGAHERNDPPIHSEDLAKKVTQTKVQVLTQTPPAVEFLSKSKPIEKHEVWVVLGAGPLSHFCHELSEVLSRTSAAHQVES